MPSSKFSKDLILPRLHHCCEMNKVRVKWKNRGEIFWWQELIVPKILRKNNYETHCRHYYFPSKSLKTQNISWKKICRVVISWSIWKKEKKEKSVQCKQERLTKSTIILSHQLLKRRRRGTPRRGTLFRIWCMNVWYRGVSLFLHDSCRGHCWCVGLCPSQQVKNWMCRAEKGRKIILP